MITKKKLAIFLSKLNIFEKPIVKLEQYETDSEIAAHLLWQACLNHDIRDKIIADLGSGTGILGIGALLLDAKKVYFVEKDKNALKTCKKNLDKKHNFELINKDINDFNKKVDTVIMNPPFGVKQRHADKAFLEKAMKISNTIYSIHKIESKEFLQKFAEEKEFRAKLLLRFDMPIKQTQKYHKTKIYRFKAGLWYIWK